MDVEELSMIGPTIDLATVDSIHRKRIVAFANHFIINTSNFLNKLSKTVDAKLLIVHNRLQKLEASLILLESKLNSIPGLDTTQAPITPLPSNDNVSQVSTETPQNEPVQEIEEEVEEKKDVIELDEGLMKYVKMLQVGVPQPAVKLKMQQEGISDEKQNLVLNR